MINNYEESKIEELGEQIYNHLLKRMNVTKEQLDLAIAENRLHVGKIEFIEDEEGNPIMRFDARIDEQPNHPNPQLDEELKEAGWINGGDDAD